jgi:hypothetical protein
MRKENGKRKTLLLVFQLAIQTMRKRPDDHSRSSGEILFDDRMYAI